MPTPQHIEDLFEDRARKGDGSFAVAYALMQLAAAQKSTAYQLERLGLGGAASPFGAIEHLAMTLDAGMGLIASALDGLGPRDD